MGCCFALLKSVLMWTTEEASAPLPLHLKEIIHWCLPQLDLYGFRYFVCNPTTKQFSTIPIPNWKSHVDIISRGSVLSLYLAFDPLKSPNYKVVSLRKSPDDYHKLRIDIYSSVTGFWTDPEVSFKPPNGMGVAGGVFCKGAIHWFSGEEHSLYFDVENQCLKTMPMPPYSNDYSRRRDIVYFGESRGHLHIVLLEIELGEAKCNIFEMQDDYSGWSLRFHTWQVLQHLEPGGIRAVSCRIYDFSSLQLDQSGIFHYFESLACV